MAYKSKFMQEMEQQGKLSAASGTSKYKSKFFQDGGHLQKEVTPAPMRAPTDRTFGTEQITQSAPVAAKPVAEKPTTQQNQISGEIAARTAGSGSTDPIGTAAHMTKLSGLQVQEAELKLSQSKAKVDAARQKKAALIEQNKKLASAKQGLRELMAQYQMTGDEVTGNAYLLATEEYNKMLEQYQKDYAAYEKDASVYDEYNSNLLKYQKAHAAYEKSVADYDKVTKPQREYEERLRHVQELRENQSVDYLQAKKNEIENQIQSIYNDPEYYSRREIYQAAVAEGRMTGEELEKLNPDREAELLRLRMENMEREIENKRSASWEAEQTEQILEAGGEQLLKDLKELARLEQMVRAEKITARNPDNNFTLQTTSKTENKYQKKQQEITEKYGQIPAEWYDYAKRAQEQESYDSAVATFGEEAKKTPVAASVLSVPLNVFGGIAGMGNIAGQKITNALLGKETPTNFKNAATLGSAGSQAVRQSVSEQIDATGAGKVGSFLYNTGMSMLDSAAILGLSALGLPSGLGTTMLGSSAAISTLQDAMENGATENQALALGILAGLAEGFFEKYSIDSLIDISDTKTARDLFMNILKQGGIEASEEAATTLANTAADLVIMGNKNQLARAKQDYISTGLSAQEAEIKAGTDWLLGLAMDAVGGFLSGGLFGTIGGTADMIRNKSADRKAQSTTGQVNAEGTESTVTQKPADMKKTTPVNAVDVENTEVNDGLQWAGNQNEGGTENVRTKQTGEPGADGDIGREDDLGAGERTGSGETGDVAGENGTDQTARYVEDLRRSGYLSEVKSESLGFTSIESKKNIAVIRADQYNEAMQAQADKARAMGVEFELVADRIPLEQNGKKMKAAGIHKPGKIIVQANNAKISMEQATDHELFHELAERDPELVNTAVQALQDEYDQTELDEMYQKYAKTYGKAYNDGRATDEQVAQRIYEEMLADAYADYERFAGSRKYRDIVRRVAENSAGSARALVSSERRTYQETDLEKRFKQAAENDTYLRKLKRQYQSGEISKQKYTRLVRNYIDRTPELNEIEAEDFDKRVEQFAIAETDDDRMVAVVDSDILENIDTSTWNSEKKAEAKKAAKTALLEFRDGVVVNGVAHKINKTSRDEYTRSNETERLYRKNKTAFADKMRAAANADDIIVATTDWARDGKLIHPRTDNIVDFTKGDVLIQAGDNQYEARTIVGITDAGEYVFYDVADMNPTTFDTKKEPSSAVSGNETENAILEGSDADPSVIGSHTEKSAASVLDASGSTVSSVSNSGTNVNESFSEESVGLQWAGNTQQQQQQPAIRVGDSLTEEIRRSAGGIDSYIAAQPGRVIDRIDKVQKKVRHELHKAMGRPADMPKDFRDTAPETIVKTYLEEGTIPRNIVNDLFDMAYKNTDWGTGPEAEKNKNFARSDFQAAMNQCMSHMQSLRRYLKEKQDLKTMDLSDVKPYKELWKTAKRARRNYSVVMAKSLLTYSDKIQLGRLLRGEITLEALSSTYNVEEIREAYEAKREYEDAMIALRAFKRAVKAARMEQASDHIGDVNAWKDKSIKIPLTKGGKRIPELGIVYSIETMERTVRDIAPTPEIAERIISTYFTPVHVNEAKATRLKNKLRKQIADLNLSREATEGKMSESAAVQFVGEAMDYIQQLKHKPKGEQLAGMTLEEWERELNQMWQDNPELNRAKIENAVKVFRRIYDQLFEMMNEVRIRNGYEPINYRRGYFPHFQEMETDTLLSRFSKALGADSEITALPTAIAGRTKDFKPGIRWTGFANERHGTETVVDAVQGFDSYVEGAADVIYHTDDIQNIRALASAIRYAGSERSVQDQVDKIRRDENLSVEEKEQKIKEIYEKTPYKLSNFVQELDEYANLLANKRSKYDREMESAIGRGIYNFLKAVQSRVGANMVAINPGSWLTNLIPISQGWPSLDTRILIKAMLDTMAHKQDGVVENSTFLTNRRGSERLVIDRRQQITNKLSKPMEWIDQFTSDSLVRARYRQNMKQGLSETAAMEEADAWAASLIADRSKGAMPTLYAATNPLIKAFTQFQLEQKNQFSYWFKDVPKEMRDKGIKFALMWVFKALLGTYMINGLFEALVGRDPAFEPLALLNEEVGNITGYSLKSPYKMVQALMEGEPIYNKQEREDLPTAAENVFKTAIEQVPFIGGFVGGGRLPISSALPDFGNLKDAAFTEAYDPETNKGMTWQERLDTAWKEISKPLFYMIMPYGGGQAKKVVENTRAVLQRGSYSTSQNLQYPVFADDPWDAAVSWAGGSIFGKTSLPPAREWVDSGFQGLNEKYTGAYRELIDMGEGDRASWELLQTMRDAEVPEGEDIDAERRRILRESSVSGEAKYMVYHDLLASDKEKERMDALEGADPETVFNLFVDMKEQDDNGDRLAILRSALTEQEKAILFDSVKEKENARLQAATKYVDSFLYADFLEAYKEKYPDEKKLPKEGEPGYKTKSERVQLILNSIDATKEEKAAVWQIFVNGKEGKNNPFSNKIGKEIWDIIQKLYKQIEDDGGLDWAGRY